MRSCYDIIRHPVVTEKTTFLVEQNKFTFVVDCGADKPAIAKAVEKIFDVKVKKVNIMNVSGKVKRFKGVLGVRKDTKKAIITLVDGYTIDWRLGGGN